MEESSKLLERMQPSENQLYGILAYVPFVSIVIYIIKDDNEDIRFHARQGLVIFGLFLIGMIPFVGIPFLIGAIIAALVGAAKAYKGIKYKLPFIYSLSKKINF